jgi:AcrR family transcriptional regulator
LGLTERKEKEKEIRRNDIIEAAEKVFFSKGYALATMDDVAREAEFSKRTVYVYFNSKEQIYFEIMVRGYKLFNGMLTADLQKKKDDSALEKIRQMGRTLFQFSNEYPDYFESIMNYETSESDFDSGIPDKLREECYAQGEKIVHYLTDTLKMGIEEGVIRNNIDIVNSAFILWSCALGIFNTTRKKANYLRHYHQRNPEDLISDAFELLIRSIQNN